MKGSGNHMVDDLYWHPNSPILDGPKLEIKYSCPDCYYDSDEPGDCEACGQKLIEKEI